MTSGARSSETPVLRTQRLTLRGWLDQDRAPFAELNADPQVMQHFPATLSRADSDAMVDRAIEIWGRGEPCWWALEDETGAFIGFTGLYAPTFEAHFTPCIEIGWRLAVHAWGKGYATEAARAAMSWGFDDGGFDEIVSFTAVPNVRSQAVMQRLGMTHDPKDDFDHPRLDDHDPLKRHVLYRMQIADWESA